MSTQLTFGIYKKPRMADITEKENFKPNLKGNIKANYNPFSLLPALIKAKSATLQKPQ